MKPNPNCESNCIRDLIEGGLCDCYNKGTHPERPCLLKDGVLYEIDYFFGRSGEPKRERDAATTCVMTKEHRSFLCNECDFL